MSHNESFLLGMPPHLFFDEFMDTEYEFEDSYALDFSQVSLGSSVKEMSNRFIQTAGRGDLCPSLHFFVPRMKKKQVKATDRATPLDLAPTVAVRRKIKPRRSQKKRRHGLEYLDFGNYTLGIELHEASEADPWYDPDYLSATGTPSKSPVPAPSAPAASHDHTTKPSSSASQNSPRRRKDRSPKKLSDANISSGSLASVDKLTDGGRALREALVSHASARFARQHQIFFFQLVLFGRYARIVRFDRSGCVVSDRIDYVEDPEVLSEFLWRFDQLSDEERGHDSTVVRASTREAELLRETVQALLDASDAGLDGTVVRRLPCAREAVDATGAWPFWRIEVNNPITGATSQLIVNYPLNTSSDLRGRNARAYIAYDIQKGKLVFVKDSWRSGKKGLRPEFQTYQDLYAHGVPHLPEVLYGGDILDTAGSVHDTATQKFTYDDDGNRKDGQPELERLIHHRIVQEIAYPLESALDEKEFIQALHDALQAIDGAYSSAGLLHRDVSLNNIMTTADGRGILNDWDHAGSKDDLHCGVGTWQFMSIAILRYPHTHLHDLVDDLQSVFWVLLSGAAKRFVLGPAKISHEIFDDKSTDIDGCTVVGGAYKYLCIMHDRLAPINFSTPPLRNLVMRCCERWRWYLLATDVCPPEDDPNIMEMLELAPKPQFWIDLFAEALRDQKATSSPPSGVAVVPPPLTLPTRTGSKSLRVARLKRKAEADVATDPPRRSKRINALCPVQRQ